MAHYVASINLFEHEDCVSISMKVFRVFDYGAAPRRPVWEEYVRVERPAQHNPREWLVQALGFNDHVV